MIDRDTVKNRISPGGLICQNHFYVWGLIREGGFFGTGGLIDHLRYTRSHINILSQCMYWGISKGRLFIPDHSA